MATHHPPTVTQQALSFRPGAGKTTLAVERLRYPLEQERIRGDDIPCLSCSALGQPYAAATAGLTFRPARPSQ